MASPIALAVGLSRLIEITCPHCRQKSQKNQKMMIARTPKQYRISPRCHRRFADPLRRER